jgi:hypothetical protein
MRFLSNLQHITHTTKQVTSNQARLFDKIVSKYSRQFLKHDLNSQDLIKLPWKSQTIESLPEFTGARVDCIDGLLNLRVPFNKKFIAYFRSAPNEFVWNKTEKMYSAPFSTNNLRILYESLPEYFKSVIYSPALHNLISQLEEYNNYIWKPTLVKVGDCFVIGAANEHLMNGLGNIELNTDTDTLVELSLYGVNIHDSLTKDNPKLKFAASRNVEVDITEIDQVAIWLRESGIMNVKLSLSVSHSKRLDDLVMIVKNSLSEHGIKWGSQLLSLYDTETEPQQYNDATAMIKFKRHLDPPRTRERDDKYGSDKSLMIKKIINILDSRPIDIK